MTHIAWRKPLTVLVAVVVALTTTSCGGMSTREKTTAGGAGAGAIIGGIIGNQSGKSWQGALIGGAVGAIGGYVVGTQIQKKGPEGHAKTDQHQRAMQAYDRANREPDKRAAIAFYTQAINLDPIHPEFYNNRGLVYLDIGDPGMARVNFEQALNIDPHYVPAQDNLRRLRHSGTGR
jgi:hypothetical protein